MRALLMMACLASASAQAADTPPELALEAHYGVMYAGRTFVHVDIRGTYDDAKGSLKPVVSMEVRSPGPCDDEGCASRSTLRKWVDPTRLVDALTQARNRLSARTDLDVYEDERRQTCEMGDSFHVVVDARAQRMRLSFDKSPDALTAVFDPDEVDHLLGMVQPASERVRKLAKQFAYFNDAAPRAPVTGTELDNVRIVSPCDPRAFDDR